MYSYVKLSKERNESSPKSLGALVRVFISIIHSNKFKVRVKSQVNDEGNMIRSEI